jgi:hypothetical protein
LLGKLNVGDPKIRVTYTQGRQNFSTGVSVEKIAGLKVSSLQEDAKPEVIVEHSEVNVIAALLVLPIMVRSLGIGDLQVSDRDRVSKDCKDR